MGMQKKRARTAFVLPFCAKKPPKDKALALRESERVNLYDPCRPEAGYGNDGECLGAPTHMVLRRFASRLKRRRK